MDQQKTVYKEIPLPIVNDVFDYFGNSHKRFSITPERIFLGFTQINELEHVSQ